MADSVVKRKTSRFRITALHTGIVMGLLAVVAGVFLGVRPPEAYGICMACHGRDMLNWTVNSIAGTHLTVSPASLTFPLLTTIGVLIGGFGAAVIHGEFRWHTPDNPIKAFIYGILVMNFALLAAGCSIRLLLRTAHGELLGMVGFLSLAVGVVLTTFWLKWRAER